jgi:glycosyltransferase involved in cell wall biosynthesis
VPSFDEGFGLTALEAMTLGVPVVASERGALPEVLGGAGLLTDPDDPDTIAAAIARVLDDTSLASDMGARGLAQAARFNWDESVRVLRDAYAVAIRRRRERAA